MFQSLEACESWIFTINQEQAFEDFFKWQFNIDEAKLTQYGKVKW